MEDTLESPRKKRKITHQYDPKPVIYSLNYRRCRHCLKFNNELYKLFEYYDSYIVCRNCYNHVKTLNPEILGLGPAILSE